MGPEGRGFESLFTDHYKKASSEMTGLFFVWSLDYKKTHLFEVLHAQCDRSSPQLSPHKTIIH
ncbi:hypothetical protein VCHA50P415_100127 [Vibrio chagasii]|nr:hypothetical protein VCHA34P114_100001 [Vibrio chagasii]CAH6804641.1 hypothetical protein VCHA34O109_100201 [Vibrio chagasii]CAH6808418.1 hypothetical protein VCHA36P164_110179 [Vibrio chagasii]CAH6808533.1 hypothetical protein VCHA34P131_120127 [Vibrio chagasii]CAH6810773.1 hypothetical protein VCHA34P121_120127 [Vibrio chagasii]